MSTSSSSAAPASERLGFSSGFGFLLSVIGFAIAVFTGWGWCTDKMLDAASLKHPLLRLWLTVSLKYICPVAIAIAIAIIFLGNFVVF